jgi:rhodanese-related sulfurtransferase
MNAPSSPFSEPPLNEQGLPAKYNFRSQWEVTPRQVRAMREQGEAFMLVDCRTEGENQLVRIEGAELVPLKDMAQRTDHLEEWSDRKLVIFCHHGMRSLQMTAMLREQGFGDVWSMAGGIDLWARDIEPGMKRY